MLFGHFCYLIGKWGETEKWNDMQQRVPDAGFELLGLTAARTMASAYGMPEFL